MSADMLAVVWDGQLRVARVPPPVLRPDWAVIRVLHAGLCRTDLELLKGYLDFRGIMGHEFVGRVTAAADSHWIGRRVVGEINAGCGQCDYCRRNLENHCPRRQVLGLVGLDGCLAEYTTLPLRNLHVVPEEWPDEQAVFVEPLAAAYEIMQQVRVQHEERCLVLGDGKLGILCAWALSTVTSHVTLAGHHPAKLDRAVWGGVVTRLEPELTEGDYDLVVEATGRVAGFQRALQLCRPRGTLILKSTLAAREPLDLAPVVIHEIHVVGSRCGPFARTLDYHRRYRFPLERLITARFPLAEAPAAFAAATAGDALKIIVDVPT